MHEKLMSIGLTKTESKIYYTLVEIGRAQAGIISRKTGIHRRSVYDALERLIKKGLVSFIKENELRYYLAEDPKRLAELALVQKEAVDSILPTLNAMFQENKKNQETSFYRGKEGIKTIFEDQLAVGKPVYIIGAAYNAEDILKYYLPHYTQKRIKKKLELNILYSGKEEKIDVPLGKIKFLPETYASPVATNIYGDNVAIILWTENPVAILIKDKEVAKTYKNYFDLLWKIAKS